MFRLPATRASIAAVLLGSTVAFAAPGFVAGLVPDQRPAGAPVKADRYITRPALADERVQLNDAGQVELKLKTPWRDGTTHLVMSPLEFMQRLAALVPRPRLHLIRFHGVLAPNAKLRALVVPQGPPKDEQAPGVAASGVQCETETVQVRPARISWARLLKRVFDIDMQRCPHCGAGELKIIAAVLERPVIEKILAHLGLDPQPPPKGRVREAGLHYAA